MPNPEEELKKERLEKLEKLKKYFFAEICEDGMDGTNFDCMILDSFQEMRKKIESEQIL